MRSIFRSPHLPKRWDRRYGKIAVVTSLFTLIVGAAALSGINECNRLFTINNEHQRHLNFSSRMHHHLGQDSYAAAGKTTVE